MSNIKIPEPAHHILDIFSNRWSSRAFSDREVATETLNSMFEAARWAPSANNEQPWQFIYTNRGTDGFKGVWNCLLPGNQPWAKNASAFVITVARKTFVASGKSNYYALHDLGLATSALLHQAIALDVHSHPMAGVNKSELSNFLQLTEDQEIACVIAVGYLAEPDTLEEPFRTREVTARSRKEVSEFVTMI